MFWICSIDSIDWFSWVWSILILVIVVCRCSACVFPACNFTWVTLHTHTTHTHTHTPRACTHNMGKNECLKKLLEWTNGGKLDFLCILIWTNILRPWHGVKVPVCTSKCVHSLHMFKKKNADSAVFRCFSKIIVSNFCILLFTAQAPVFVLPNSTKVSWRILHEATK